jgi:2-polyprenyl-6-methoxyphenol hydroxylase-like FAD-dependent oxidoreductase
MGRAFCIGWEFAEELGRTGVKPVTFDQRRWDDGRVLLRSKLGEAVESAFGAPYYTLHRGDLHRALADAIPADHVHLGHRFTHLVDHGDRVEAHFENGVSISADALIGADGIHSVVRHALFGPEKPRFTGCVAHRSMVLADRLTHLGLESRNQIWMGPSRHFVHQTVARSTDTARTRCSGDPGFSVLPFYPSPTQFIRYNGLRTRSLNDPRRGSLPTVQTVRRKPTHPSPSAR